MPGPKTLPNQPFVQNSGIVERLVGSSLFLAEEAGEAIFQLNETGAALWRFLAEPGTLEGAVDTFRQAFPDRDQDELSNELTALMAALHRQGLIVAAA
ncbi:MAG: PqqD family protein [Alphaproteobacteria bacterium]